MDVSFFVVEAGYSDVQVSSDFLQVSSSSIAYTTKKRHIRDILGRTIFFLCHAYDPSMTIIVTKPGIIIDVVGSYFYDKKS